MDEIIPDLISPEDADYIYRIMKAHLRERNISRAAQYWMIISADFPEEYDLELGY